MTDLRDAAGGNLPDDITEDSVTEAVLASIAGAPDPRLAECLCAIVRQLHAAIREVEPTIAEWETAIDWLTRTGQKCDATRQEFVLASDVLGVSALVENINHRKTGGATEATVLGPFHMVESPRRNNGDSIDLVGGRQPAVVTGRVLTTAGEPICGATIDVWQADENGYYDVQRPDLQPLGNGRGLFSVDELGRFSFRTVVPSHYPIPTDGPVGDLLNATARHPYRPAHIHFIASAAGYTPVTTHIFVAGSPYLDSDAVFAVKRSLVRAFITTDDPSTADAYGIPTPFQHADIDLVLESDRP